MPASKGQRPNPVPQRKGTVLDNQATGIAAITGHIRRTFGPAGLPALIPVKGGGFSEESTSAAIAARFRPLDPREVGAGFVRNLVTTIQDSVGDGAATAALLAHAMIEAALVRLHQGDSPTRLRAGTRTAAAAALQEISEQSRDLETKEQLASLISVAAGDAHIGEVISDAFDKIGREGFFRLEDSRTLDLDLEVVIKEGIHLDTGYISPDLVTGHERMETVLKSPSILILDSRFSLLGSRFSVTSDLAYVLKQTKQTGRPLLIIAEDLKDGALTTLVTRMARDAPPIVIAEPHSSGDQRRAVLGDIAAFTTGRVVDGANFKLTDIASDQLGSARKVIVTRDRTTIVEGDGDARAVMARVEQLRAEIAHANTDHDRQKLQQRLAGLAGGTAIIKVNAATTAELKDRTQRIKNAIKVGYAGIEHGIVPGGGVVLLAARSQLRKIRAAQAELVSWTLNSPYN